MEPTDRQPPGSAFDALASIAAMPIDDAIGAYRDHMRTAYWEANDLALLTGIAFGAVSRLLAAANDAADADAAYRYRSAAKGLVYDYASFAWVGWGQPGITVSENEAAAAMAAAITNHRMAVELDKGDLALSRAQWMIGAHLLTAGRFDDAAVAFLAAAEHAAQADETPGVLLNQAYATVARIGAGESGASDVLEETLDALAATEHGDDFVEQVRTVAKVLGFTD